MNVRQNQQQAQQQVMDNYGPDGMGDRPGLTEEFVNTVHIATNVFEKMNAYYTPPYPTTYKIWYYYVKGTHSALVDRVDGLLEGSNTLSPFDIEQINEEFFKLDNSVSIDQIIEPSVEKSFDELAVTIEANTRKNKQYVEVVSNINHSLNQTHDRDELNALLGRLVDENERVSAATTALISILAESQKEISQLKSKIQDAQASRLTDKLTNIGNQKFFLAEIKREALYAREMKLPLCLTIIKIDNFNAVNDQFGRLIGDEVLKIIGSLLDNSTKGRDKVARIGGRKFAAILPRTTLENAHILLEQVRHEVEEICLVVKKSNQSIGNLTISAGLTLLRDGEESGSMLERAEALLDQAEANQTVIQSPGSPDHPDHKG